LYENGRHPKKLLNINFLANDIQKLKKKRQFIIMFRV